MPIRNRLPCVSVSMRSSQRCQRWPRELDALVAQQCLKVLEPLRAISDRARRKALFEAEHRQESGDLTHVPLDWMEPESTVGDVSDAQVLPTRKQVLDSNRHHRAERDLKGPTAEVE